MFLFAYFSDQIKKSEAPHRLNDYRFQEVFESQRVWIFICRTALPMSLSYCTSVCYSTSVQPSHPGISWALFEVWCYVQSGLHQTCCWLQTRHIIHTMDTKFIEKFDCRQGQKPVQVKHWVPLQRVPHIHVFASRQSISTHTCTYKLKRYQDYWSTHTHNHTCDIAVHITKYNRVSNAVLHAYP